MREFKLMIDVPFLPKGSIYCMNDETAEVFWKQDDGNWSEYPLRPGLAGYLWLLATERKYMRKIS